MLSKNTLAQILEKAIRVHGDEYDYSLVIDENLTRWKDKIEIICKKHGVFKQTIGNHTNNEQGCPKCYGKPVVDTKLFIERANAIHGIGTYGYDLANYIDAKTKVKIRCPKHGIFEQTPHHHTKSKSGCPKCNGRKEGYTTELFIEKAKEIHGENTYIYTNTIYKQSRDEVEITCPKHGSWMIKAYLHLQGHMCRECYCDSKRRTKEEILAKAKLKHGDRYDYSLNTHDFGMQDKIKIICQKHGVFLQVAANHVNGGHGCISCSNAKFKDENAWLDSLNIPKEYRQIWINIDGRRFSLDALDPITNTIYEYNGDFHHGNPNNKRFPHDKINPRNKKTYGELYKATLEREAILKSAGYNLITIWESDWLAQKKLAKKK
jgi:hypothetical protein